MDKNSTIGFDAPQSAILNEAESATFVIPKNVGSLQKQPMHFSTSSLFKLIRWLNMLMLNGHLTSSGTVMFAKH